MQDIKFFSNVSDSISLLSKGEQAHFCITFRYTRLYFERPDTVFLWYSIYEAELRLTSRGLAAPGAFSYLSRKLCIPRLSPCTAHVRHAQKACLTVGNNFFIWQIKKDIANLAKYTHVSTISFLRWMLDCHSLYGPVTTPKFYVSSPIFGHITKAVFIQLQCNP